MLIKIVNLFFEVIAPLKERVVIFWKNHYNGIRLFSNSSLEMREFLSVKYIYHNLKPCENDKFSRLIFTDKT